MPAKRTQKRRLLRMAVDFRSRFLPSTESGSPSRPGAEFTPSPRGDDLVRRVASQLRECAVSGARK